MMSHGFGTSASREGLDSGMEGRLVREQGLIFGAESGDLVLAVVFRLLRGEEGSLGGSELMLGGLRRAIIRSS
jgi:hypothetical protein